MKANSKVNPYKGVKTKNGEWTKYAVSQNKKQPDGTWKKVGWVSVMIKGGAEIPEKNPDKASLFIDSIQSVDLDEYNGKTTVTIWADGHVEGGTPYSPVTSGFSQLDDSDFCPF